MREYEIRYTRPSNPSKMGSLFDTVNSKHEAEVAIKMLEALGFKAWRVTCG